MPDSSAHDGADRPRSFGDASLFLERWEEVRQSGQSLTLQEWLNQFPDDPEMVARTWLSSRGSSSEGAPAGEGETFGPYEIEEELGRGGQGVVYKAHDTRIGRTVALKVLSAVGPDTEKLIQRFQREARVTARLEHPGICTVYEAGIQGVVPFIAMQYVDGISLSEQIQADRSSRVTEPGQPSIISFENDNAESHVPPDQELESKARSGKAVKAEVRRVIRFIEQTARALHAAHEAGVIHRDIKPNNILIARNEQPVILDFGMAHDDDAVQSLTRSGDLFGTPAYMSPEQLMAQHITLDRRTDIWSLGVTIYECLTLERPFAAASRQGLFQAIMASEPQDPRQFNKEVTPELVVILQTCLEKNRDKRYATALDLAEDLRRVREYEPILAQPVSRWTRLKRWCQRNPAVATALLGFTLAAPVVAALVSYGIGTRGKADLEAQLREKAEENLTTVQHEKERLTFREMAAALTADLEVYSATAGTITFGAGGVQGFETTLREGVRLFERHGIDLKSPDDLKSLMGRMGEVEADTANAQRVLTSALGQLLWYLDSKEPQTTSPAQPSPANAEYQAVRFSIRSVLTSLPDNGESKEIAEAMKIKDPDNRHEALAALCDPQRLASLSCAQAAELAAACATNGMMKESADAFSQATFLDPRDFVAHLAAGGILLGVAASTDSEAEAAKHIARSLGHLRIARALRPHSGLSCSMLATSYAISGQYEKAEHLSKRSVVLDPESGLVHFMRGMYLHRSRRSQEAITHLEQALEIMPGLVAAENLLKGIRQGQ